MWSPRKLRAGGVLLAPVVLCSLLLGCGDSGDSGAGNKTVRLYISGDVNVRDLWEKDLIPAFKKANSGYDVTVTFSEHGQNDTQTIQRISQSVKADKDPGFDVIEGGPATILAQNKWSYDIDDSNVPNIAGVPEAMLTPALGRAAPYRSTTVALAYNTKFVKTPPTTLGDLISWIKEHPGKFVYNKPDGGGSGQSFVVTVLDQYVPDDAREKLVNSYAVDEEKNWEEGLEELKDLKEYMYEETYSNSNEDTLALLGNENVWMAPVWVDMALTGKANGSLPESLQLSQIADPSFTGGAVYLAVPKSSDREDAAVKLMNFVLEKQQQATIVDILSGFPAINLDQLPEKEQTKFEGMSNSDLRLTYQSQVLNDLNQQWLQNVA